MYYGINHLRATEITATPQNIHLSNNSFEYTVRREKVNTFPGNFAYVFHIEAAGHPSEITSNNWRITKVESPSHFNPSKVLFNIIDPEGRSNEQGNILRRRPGLTEHSISFSGVGLSALNEGLALLSLLSQYRHWDEFLRSTDAGEFMNKTTDNLRRLNSENEDLRRRLSQITDLESENNELRAKLNEIKRLVTE